MLNDSSVDPILQALRSAFEANDPGCQEKSREQETFAHLTGFLRAIGQGRFSELLPYFHEDVVIRIQVPSYFPFLTLAEGPHQSASLLSANFKSLAQEHLQILNVVVQGQEVAFRIRERGKILQMQREYHVEVASFFEFKDGLLYAVNQYVCDV